MSHLLPLRSPPAHRPTFEANLHVFLRNIRPTPSAQFHPLSTSEEANKPGMCSTPGWLRLQKKQARRPLGSSTAIAFGRRSRSDQLDLILQRLPADVGTRRRTSVSEQVDKNSTGTATPDAMTSRVPKAACYSRGDSAFPETSENVH